MLVSAWLDIQMFEEFFLREIWYFLFLNHFLNAAEDKKATRSIQHTTDTAFLLQKYCITPGDIFKCYLGFLSCFWNKIMISIPLNLYHYSPCFCFSSLFNSKIDFLAELFFKLLIWYSIYIHLILILLYDIFSSINYKIFSCKMNSLSMYVITLIADFVFKHFKNRWSFQMQNSVSHSAFLYEAAKNFLTV